MDTQDTTTATQTNQTTPATPPTPPTPSTDSPQAAQSPTQQTQSPVPTDRPQLLDAVRRQVEFYLSRENLQSDAYLVSQMDAGRYVALELIASFNRLRRLLADDRNLLLDAIASSTVVQLDETHTKVRPLVAPQRSTLILREVPDLIAEPEIRAMLEAGQVTGVTDVRPDIANTWFISFHNEDEARNALSYVRDQELAGVPIRVRLKTETLLRTSQTPAFVAAEPAAPAAEFGQYAPPFESQQYFDSNYRGDYRRSSRGGGGRRGAGADRGPPPSNSAPYRNNRRTDSDSSDRRRGGPQRRRDGYGHTGSGSAQTATAATVVSTAPPRKPAAPVALSAANFPPLPNKRGTASSDLKTYSKADIVDVLHQLSDVERPEGLLTDGAVVLDSPNRTLASDTPTSEPLLATAPPTAPEPTAVTAAPTTTSAPSRQSWSRVLSEPVAAPTAVSSAASVHSAKSTSIPLTATKSARKDRKDNRNKKQSEHNSSGGGNNSKKKPATASTTSTSSSSPAVATSASSSGDSSPASPTTPATASHEEPTPKQ